MKWMARILLLAMIATLCITLGDCNKGKDNEKGRVYYLNFKPEQNDDWQALAKVYTQKTGVPVTVLTAADNQYESTLATEMDKTEAPTLFQVNGPTGLMKWKNDCYDLSGSTVYQELSNEQFAL